MLPTTLNNLHTGQLSTFRRIFTEAYPVATIIEATTEVIALKNWIALALEPTLLVVDETRYFVAILVLSLQARARLRLGVTVAFAVTASKVDQIRGRHVVTVPDLIAVVKFPGRCHLLVAVYVVDNRDVRRIRLVLVSVLDDDGFEHVLCHE
jgi:hypothetical protein